MTDVNFDNGLEELDSELDNFLAEIDDIEQSKMVELPEEPSLAVWKECIDETTKHPYYWHIVTQEVTWVKPESYDNNLKAQETAMRQWRKQCDEVKSINEERKKAIEERKKAAEIQRKAAAPRKNPRIELENETNGKKAIDVTDGSIGKIGKFNFLKSEAEQKLPAPTKNSARLTFTVKKASSPTPEVKPSSPARPPSPPEPAPKRPKITVPTHTPSGKQRTVTEIAAEIKRKKQQIALTNARIHLQKRVEEQNLSKKALEVPAKQESSPVEVKSKAKEDVVTKELVADPPACESKKKRIFQETKSKSPVKEVDKDAKRAIEKEASLLKEKLEFWGGDLKRLSKFQIQIIQLGTRISDFIEGHLSETYIQSKISEMGQMLRTHEENSVPKEWTCTYDREEKKYRYTNKNTGKSQFTHPGEDDDKSSSASGSDSEPDKDDDLYEMFQQEIKEIETTVKSSKPSVKKDTTPPPTPPPVSPPPIPPPPPAEITSPVVLPPVPPLPEPCQQEQPPGWADLATPEPWVAPPSFPGLPSVPPPPPPDDGMMEAYSPGNSDTEEEEEQEEAKNKKEDLGVVSVKAPMRYDTPPAVASVMFASAPTVISSLSSAARSSSPGAAVSDEGTPSQTVDESPDMADASQDSGAAARKPIKKKKKTENLMLGSGNKKQKKMNSLVAKWNKVNKHADTALK